MSLTSEGLWVIHGYFIHWWQRSFVLPVETVHPAWTCLLRNETKNKSWIKSTSASIFSTNYSHPRARDSTPFCYRRGSVSNASLSTVLFLLVLLQLRPIDTISWHDEWVRIQKRKKILWEKNTEREREREREREKERERSERVKEHRNISGDKIPHVHYRNVVPT